jgi:hypothetical protein
MWFFSSPLLTHFRFLTFTSRDCPYPLNHDPHYFASGVTSPFLTLTLLPLRTLMITLGKLDNLEITLRAYYQRPIAAMSYHKLSGLKKHTFSYNCGGQISKMFQQDYVTSVGSRRKLISFPFPTYLLICLPKLKIHKLYRRY